MAGSKPTYYVRAKQSPDSEYFTTVGAVWPMKERDGYVMKLNMLPTQFDGDLLIVPPKDE